MQKQNTTSLKRTLGHALLATLMLTASSQNAAAGLSVADKKPSMQAWIGQWKSVGGFTTIYQLNSLLAISGTDEVSSYQMTCLPDTNWTTGKIHCVGNGHQFDGDGPVGTAFTIESDFTMRSPDELEEHWRVRLWNAMENKVMELETTLKHKRKKFR